MLQVETDYMTLYLQNMKHIRVYYVILALLASLLLSCNVCDNGDTIQESPVRNIYFNAKNLNNESVNIFGISAEGSDLEEVLVNSIILAPPSEKGHILYSYYGSKRDVALYSIKKRSHHLVSKFFEERLICPCISPDASYILSYSDKDKLLLIGNSYDSVFNKKSEIPVKYNKPNHSISPNSQLFAYFDVEDSDKLALYILDNNVAGIKQKVMLNHKMEEVKNNFIYWNANSNILFILINEKIDYIYKYDIVNNSLVQIPIDENINGLAMESDNTIYCSGAGGAIFRLEINGTKIASKTIIFENRNDFIVGNLYYSSGKNMLLFTSKADSTSYGNIYVYDIRLKTINYIFSNASSPYWARDRQ